MATLETGDVDAGTQYDLGGIRMQLHAASTDTGGAFALGEFRGGPGPWTVPHVHSQHDESFYVLEGSFTFTVGDEVIAASAGAYVPIPRDLPHLIEAGPGGGRLLALWVPGGLDQMFIELSALPPGSLRDPETRRSLSAHFDSKPV